MVSIAGLSDKVNTGSIYAMRQSGSSLQQIADRIGRTKERVRQILVKHYGSTKRRLFSTDQLYHLLDLPRNQIIELYKDGIILPAYEWQSGRKHYLLWHPTAVQDIIDYYKTHKQCRICHRIIPKGRWIYCSDTCYREGQKYSNMTNQAKKRRSTSVKRCLQNQKRPVGLAVSN
jgi:predicted nucleic acid-binding Zn ribbon protein